MPPPAPPPGPPPAPPGQPPGPPPDKPVPRVVLALFAPDSEDEEEDEGLIDTSGLKDQSVEDSGVASGADSGAWTFTPTGEPPRP